MDCLFCKIGHKEIPSEFVYENGAAFAILDIMPRAPGHTMVIPKTHVETILDLPDNELEPLFHAVKSVTEKIKQALSPDGFTIGINHGKVSGQVIDHLHVHIIPRFADDKGGSIHSVVNNPPQESLAEVASRIRAVK